MDKETKKNYTPLEDQPEETVDEEITIKEKFKPEELYANPFSEEKTKRYEKLKFYYKNKIPIKFRLIEPKNHWEIKGKIELITRWDIILIYNNIKLYFQIGEIVPLTILPSEFKQVVDNIRIPISPELREFIFNRDDYKCQLKLEGCTNLATEIDHKISINDGGNNNPENLWASCLNCNRKKGKNSIC